MTDVAEIAAIVAKLTEARRAVFAAMLSERWNDWFSAADFANYNVAIFGSQLSAMARLKLFERRADPRIWGRGQYRLSPLGLAVQSYIKDHSA